MPPKAQKAAAGRLIGYARVATEEQGTDPQTDELRAAGCATIREEHASGADRSRPVLARLLRDIAAGETLVVVRLDRLARSVSHLLAVIEQLAAKEAYFHSLHDPIDTTTAQGMFSLQVLGAIAQLERAPSANAGAWRQPRPAIQRPSTYEYSPLPRIAAHRRRRSGRSQACAMSSQGHAARRATAVPADRPQPAYC